MHRYCADVSVGMCLVSLANVKLPKLKVPDVHGCSGKGTMQRWIAWWDGVLPLFSTEGMHPFANVHRSTVLFSSAYLLEYSSTGVFRTTALLMWWVTCISVSNIACVCWRCSDVSVCVCVKFVFVTVVFLCFVLVLFIVVICQVTVTDNCTCSKDLQCFLLLHSVIVKLLYININ